MKNRTILVIGGTGSWGCGYGLSSGSMRYKYLTLVLVRTIIV